VCKILFFSLKDKSATCLLITLTWPLWRNHMSPTDCLLEIIVFQLPQELKIRLKSVIVSTIESDRVLQGIVLIF
jgi:hypothetical protein